MKELKNARLTGVRREIKYKLTGREGRIALEQLRKRVPPKLVGGSPSGFRVSIYLDNKERTLSTAAVENNKVVTKVRVREYYRLENEHPKFGEQGFMEVKTRIGQMVEKSRFAVERPLLKTILRSGPPSLPRDDEEASAQETFEAVRGSDILEPIFVVHYRRFTLQDPENRIRITIDDMISYHLPTPEILLPPGPNCAREDLPPPLFVEPHWIVEIKSVGPLPSWVEDILSPNRRISYSKFSTGVQELVRRHRLYSAQL